VTTGNSETQGAKVMREFLPQSPFVQHLGIEVVEIGAGSARLRAPFRPELATMGETVHGGAIATLIDTAAMVAAWSDAAIPDNLRGATVSLTVSYLAPAQGEDLTAHAAVVHRGRRLVTVDVKATSASGAVVAKALVTYQLG
jgi:uncharacterized protein (TIGR00369 family)